MVAGVAKCSCYKDILLSLLDTLFGHMIKHYQRNLTQLNTTFCPNLSICCLKDELWGMSKKGLTKLTDPIRETCVKVIGFFCQTNWAKWGSLLQLSSDGVIKLYQVQCVPNKGGLIPALESESEYDSRPQSIPDSGTGSFPWNHWIRFHH